MGLERKGVVPDRIDLPLMYGVPLIPEEIVDGMIVIHAFGDFAMQRYEASRSFLNVFVARRMDDALGVGTYELLTKTGENNVFCYRYDECMRWRGWPSGIKQPWPDPVLLARHDQLAAW